MKKVALASLLAIATSMLCATPIALAQAAASGGGAAQQITIKDPAEYNDYSNAISQSSPAAKASAIEAFLTKYPNSVVKEEMLEQLMAAYQAQNNMDKTVDAASRLLQADPNNLRALAITVYIKKAQAAQKSTPADQQPLLDEAAASAQKGLAAPKPANMPDADFEKLKAATAPIFYSAIAMDDQLKKDYPGAVDNFKKELAAVPVAQTQTGPQLNDTYLLGQAYAQQTPPDLKNAVWFLTRAAAYAPPAAKDQIEKAAEYYYNKYHGSMDGFDQVKTLVTQSVLPPDSYNPTAAPPPPSPADQAAKVVATTPDLKTLNLNDKEFILFNGKPEDADKMWDDDEGADLPDSGQGGLGDGGLRAACGDGRREGVEHGGLHDQHEEAADHAAGDRHHGELRRHLRFVHAESEDDHADRWRATRAGEAGTACSTPPARCALNQECRCEVREGRPANGPPFLFCGGKAAVDAW